MRARTVWITEDQEFEGGDLFFLGRSSGFLDGGEAIVEYFSAEEAIAGGRDVPSQGTMSARAVARMYAACSDTSTASSSSRRTVSRRWPRRRSRAPTVDPGRDSTRPGRAGL